ncbi:carboxymuconolactone decarboxylase family protein [Empedobacter brevis]|uniref:carboxymuconolactone decarboxylase family protein n=1 Tax=Empedobacter brevis TaxID=247 RepID=UPI00123D4107|nr:carboxymuconolactone decarboxylase family protein [Empedobacter brevis]QES94096.1 carboxymuconolactone decarboxylase family protein [Empedobacter brevis]
MKNRLNIQKLAPKAYEAMYGLENFLANSELEKLHLELIKIRASQLNGCAFCINMHTKDAIKIGETNQRIFLLNAWQETTLFTEEERIILSMTEEITQISEHGLTDETYEKATTLFTEKYISLIIIAVTTINAWNRIAISSRIMV